MIVVETFEGVRPAQTAVGEPIQDRHLMTRAALLPIKTPAVHRLGSQRRERAPLSICRAQTLSSAARWRQTPPPARSTTPFVASPEPANPQLVTLAALAGKPTPRLQIPIGARQPKHSLIRPAVSSMGGFRTPAPVQAAPAQQGPASETLHQSSPTSRVSSACS